MGTHVCMQASDCVINYLNKNKFLLPYLQTVILFCTLTSKNAIFICLGEISCDEILHTHWYIDKM